MKALLIISLVLASLGFIALAAIPPQHPGGILASIVSASLGCIGLVVYGVKTNAR